MINSRIKLKLFQLLEEVM
jgi:hypothetical protein